MIDGRGPDERLRVLLEAPSGRYLHTAVGTGSEMIVWGGDYGPLDYLYGCGRYNCMKDDDGWGDAAAALPVVAGTDCDDASATRFPGATDLCGDGIDQDCDGFDVICSPAQSQLPELTMRDSQTVAFTPIAGLVRYHIYRGGLHILRDTGVYTQDPMTGAEAERFCYLDPQVPVLVDPFLPVTGRAVFYLVTGSDGLSETSLGTDSAGRERPNDYACIP